MCPSRGRPPARSVPRRARRRGRRRQVDVGRDLVPPAAGGLLRRPAGGRRPPPPRPPGDARCPRRPRADRRQAPRPRTADGHRLDRRSTPACAPATGRLAAAAGVPCHAVVVDTPERETRRRNRDRPEAVPSAVVTGQLRSVATVDAARRRGLRRRPSGLRRTRRARAPALYDTPAAARRQEEQPMTMRFGLQIGRFTWPGGPAETGPRLGAIARAAEDAGFSSLSVMDHFVQIPTVGREWEDMLESTRRSGSSPRRRPRSASARSCRGISTATSPTSPRSWPRSTCCPAGRAFCGLGAAWFGREHELYGWPFPPVAERYELLEDALELLPLMWGKGTPRVRGSPDHVPAATCYPRPLQDHVPILVGGSGERRTLRLVARHADACNLFGDPATVARKVEVAARALRRRRPRPGVGDDHEPVGGGDPRRLGRRRRARRRRRGDGRGAHRPLPPVGRGRRRRRPSWPSASTAPPTRSRRSPR